MYVFLSHSSKDAKITSGLCNELENNGIKCFIAPRDIRVGHEYASEIIEGIDKSDAMILVLSNDSNTSPHVLREIERAVSKNIPIIVYRIEDVILTKSMEYFLMTHQWVNGKSNDYQEMIAAIRNLNYKGDREKQVKIQNESKKSKNKKAVMIAVAALVCVLGLSVFGIIYAISGNSKNNENNNSTQSSQLVGDDSTENNSTEDSSTENEVREPLKVELGDEIIFGKYNGESIKWRVINISEDKKDAVLIASEIITMKAFDAADSEGFCQDQGEYYFINRETKADTDLEFQAFIRGNSEWASSDIRAWLNEEKSLANYGDSAPSDGKMSDRRNGYDIEPGFLTNFSKEEVAAIKKTTVETKGNDLSGEGIITTEDKVFLLSVEELKWLEDANMNILTYPTAECLEQDKSGWYDMEYEAHGTRTYCWWLRDPVEGFSSKCYMVGTEYYDEKIWEKEVGLEGYGIRPAITVDLTSDVFNTED